MTTSVQNNTMSASLLAAMNPSTSSTSSTSSTDAMQNQFMTLLVTQMQNQDPLNPMDNSEVTSQLAQLSTVTGINQLNTTLTALQGSSQTYQAASMIGHGVLVPGSNITLSSGSGYMGVDLASAASNVQVTISDSTGKAVRTMNLGKMDAGTQTFKWDGTTDSGTTAADGNYTFKVTATQGTSAVTATALGFGSVSSVSTGTSGVQLNVAGIGTVNVSDVKQIL
jgi:flagellar basal-body rod modification protein FlgD